MMLLVSVSAAGVPTRVAHASQVFEKGRPIFDKSVGAISHFGRQRSARCGSEFHKP